ncbi:MAG TPA: HNH endonuclease [Candidatus Paceibacterota bacterium]|nr:HNH endonuclease [Candidatus Paceibacterota bacterium]
MQRTCAYCERELKQRWNLKFCSNQCQADFRYKTFKDGWITGSRKVITKNISGHIKRFLLETYGDKCSRCAWDEKHPTTLRVPLEVDHVDGNSDNNARENVRLLCPNCHSLTPSFRNLNRGKGRSWRKEYLKKNTPSHKAISL